MNAAISDVETRTSEPSLAEVLQRLDREAVHDVFVNGRTRCRYYTWGQGPPLLLIPGLAAEGRFFALLCAQLAPSFRCIAFEWPTRRGAGAARLHLDGLVADVFALLDHLQASPCAVLGFSFGSTAALAALRARPQRLSSAVLVGGFAQRRLAPAEVLLARLIRHWQAPLRVLPWHDAILRRSHYPPFADRPPELWRFFLDQCGALSIAAVARRALLLHGVDLRPDLPAIRQPVLLVTGDADPLVPDVCLQTLRQGLPSAAHVELSDCGHYAPLTHPGPLAAVVRQFLTPPPCATDAGGAACSVLQATLQQPIRKPGA